MAKSSNNTVVRNDATANMDSLKSVLFDTVKLVNSVSQCVTSELLEKIKFFNLTSANVIDTISDKAYKDRNKAYNLARMTAFGAWLATDEAGAQLAQLDTWTKSKKSGNEVVNLRAYRIEDKSTSSAISYSVRYSDMYNAYSSILTAWLKNDHEAVFASIEADTFHADFMAQKYTYDQAKKAEREAASEAVKADGADKTDPEGNDIELPEDSSEALQVLFNRIGNFKRAIRQHAATVGDLDVIGEYSESIKEWTADLIAVGENQAKVDKAKTG